MVEGVDYAFSSPSPAGLYAAGKRFAMRYVGPGSDDKHLHADERDAIWAAGLDINLLAEGTSDGALGGLPTGIAHANSALTAADFLGAPTSVPIYFAVDFDVTSTQWPAVANYLRGAASVIGASRVGIYGGIRAMQWAARDGVATWFFQTYAWSAGQWYAGNHVEQYHNGVALAGGTVDLCRAITVQYGQWGPNQEDDMTPEQAQQLDDIAMVVDGMANMRDNYQGRFSAIPVEIVRAIKDLQAKVEALSVPSAPAVGPVDLSDASVVKVADATAAELHDRLAQ